MNVFYKILTYFIFKHRAVAYKIRMLWFYIYFKRNDILIGQNLLIRGTQWNNIFGKKLLIYDNVVIESHSRSAFLTIGDNCVLSYGVIISCSSGITIGNNVWIGEYTSIRDSTHSFNICKSINSNLDLSNPILIGNNVWIGRNTLIQPGATIDDNVIIGANSLVYGKCESNSLYAGSPAILRKKLI